MSKRIEISNEIYEEIKSQLKKDEVSKINGINDMIGKCFYFRTVSYHQVGRVTGIFNDFIQLEDASWIADSGRFTQAIKNGELNEVEPVGIFFINLKAVVDFCPWIHELPKEQK